MDLNATLQIVQDPGPGFDSMSPACCSNKRGSNAGPFPPLLKNPMPLGCACLHARMKILFFSMVELPDCQRRRRVEVQVPLYGLIRLILRLTGRIEPDPLDWGALPLSSGVLVVLLVAVLVVVLV